MTCMLGWWWSGSSCAFICDVHACRCYIGLFADLQIIVCKGSQYCKHFVMSSRGSGPQAFAGQHPAACTVPSLTSHKYLLTHSRFWPTQTLLGDLSADGPTQHVQSLPNGGCSSLQIFIGLSFLLTCMGTCVVTEQHWCKPSSTAVCYIADDTGSAAGLPHGVQKGITRPDQVRLTIQAGDVRLPRFGICESWKVLSIEQVSHSEPQEEAHRHVLPVMPVVLQPRPSALISS